MSAPWQPIETAPRGGTPVLLWLATTLDGIDTSGPKPRSIPAVVGWATDDERQGGSPVLHAGFCEEQGSPSDGSSWCSPIDLRASHWMPLPAAPMSPAAAPPDLRDATALVDKARNRAQWSGIVSARADRLALLALAVAFGGAVVAIRRRLIDRRRADGDAAFGEMLLATIERVAARSAGEVTGPRLSEEGFR